MFKIYIYYKKKKINDNGGKVQGKYIETFSGQMNMYNSIVL